MIVSRIAVPKQMHQSKSVTWGGSPLNPQEQIGIVDLVYLLVKNQPGHIEILATSISKAI